MEKKVKKSNDVESDESRNVRDVLAVPSELLEL